MTVETQEELVNALEERETWTQVVSFWVLDDWLFTPNKREKNTRRAINVYLVSDS